MKNRSKHLLIAVSFLGLVSCSKKETVANGSENPKAVEVANYGVTAKGDSIKLYTLQNKNGMKMEVINYGGIITSLTAPNKDGKYEDVVLGYTKPQDYFVHESDFFFGALIGRYGNRIANAKFSLDGKSYDLDKNDGVNHLHGGKEGFFSRVWNVEVVKDAKQPTLKLTYVSADGEQGYPGKLTSTVLYTLTDDNALEISYEANTDKETIVNLTQHTYFNLSGNFTKPITDHELQLNAKQFTPVNSTLIPTGELKAVAGTPFDFTTSKLIGKDIDAKDEQLKLGKGYDHNWVLEGSGMRTIGTLYHAESGRMMEISTTEPGVQFYSGNFLNGKYDTKTGGKNDFRTGLCLETQHFPDSPNQPSFPSTVLKPGETYKTKTIYKFSVKK